jgi:hypothetical protein
LRYTLLIFSGVLCHLPAGAMSGSVEWVCCVCTLVNSSRTTAVSCSDDEDEEEDDDEARHCMFDGELLRGQGASHCPLFLSALRDATAAAGAGAPFSLSLCGATSRAHFSFDLERHDQSAVAALGLVVRCARLCWRPWFVQLRTVPYRERRWRAAFHPAHLHAVVCLRSLCRECAPVTLTHCIQDSRADVGGKLTQTLPVFCQLMYQL